MRRLMLTALISVTSLVYHKPLRITYWQYSHCKRLPATMGRDTVPAAQPRNGVGSFVFICLLVFFLYVKLLAVWSARA